MIATLREVIKYVPDKSNRAPSRNDAMQQVMAGLECGSAAIAEA
jgi:hypothetical protein